MKWSLLLRRRPAPRIVPLGLAAAVEVHDARDSEAALRHADQRPGSQRKGDHAIIMAARGRTCSYTPLFRHAVLERLELVDPLGPQVRAW
jgi:hypothetical protein